MTESKTKKVAKPNETPDSRPKDVAPAPVSGPVPPGLNDTREDGAPVVGHFVEITKGEDEGFFGVLIEVTTEGDGVVRSRADAGDRRVAPLSDLKATDAYRR